MKMVGIVGSPRKGMNTDILVQAVLKGCSHKGSLTELVYLNDLNIKPCQACRLQDGKGCRQRDDMDVLYRVFMEADGMVIGAPIYYSTVSSQIKLMLDRSYCLAKEVISPTGKSICQTMVPKRKKGILICVAGGPYKTESIFAPFIQYWADEVNLELTHKIFVSHTIEDGKRIEPGGRKDLIEQLVSHGEYLSDMIWRD